MRKMSENLCQILANERITGKTGINVVFWSQFDKVFHIFMAFLYISLRKVSNQKILSAQKNTLLESLS